MALSSVFTCLSLFLIVPAAASGVVRRTAIESNGRVKSHSQGKSGLGLPFWRQLRKELEAKKTGLNSEHERESSLLSAGARRDLLWQAVREVDGKFHKKFMCALDGNTAYAKDAMFLQGQAAYSKINVASPRECALMCAADSLADPSHKDLACKSFAYNKTGQECKFFNFAHQGKKASVADVCCTTGPPCNLESMRDEIQTHFQVELKRTTLKVPNQHAVPKVVLSPAATTHAAPKVEQKAAPQIKRVAPKIEQKVMQTRPKVGQKTAPRVLPKVDVKAAPPTKQVAPKVEHKVMDTKPKIEQKAAPRVQTKPATKPSSEKPAAQPLKDHVSHKIKRKAHKAVQGVRRKARKAANWMRRHRACASVIGIAGVILAAIALCRLRGYFATTKPLKNNSMHGALFNDNLVAKKAAASY